LITPQFSFHHITEDVVRQHISRQYSLKNVVVVGVGIDHAALVNGAESFDIDQTKPTEKPIQSKYFGGESRNLADGNSHIAIAFEGAALRDSREALAFGALKHLLGGGSIFSYKHGVGSGLASPLYTKVVQPNPWILQVSAFNFSYSDSGLFGVYGEAQPGRTGQLISTVTAEVARVVKGQLDSTEVNRAKALLKASILNADHGEQSLQFLASQVFAGASKVATADELASQVDSLTAEDIKRAASRVLRSTPTVVSLGDVADVPSVADVQALLSK